MARREREGERGVGMRDGGGDAGEGYVAMGEWVWIGKRGREAWIMKRHARHQERP